MNVLTKHEEMVLRLCKPGEAILDSLTPDDCHLIHIGGCLSGEAAELYEAFTVEVAGKGDPHEQFLEELGDFLFYLVALRRIFQVPVNPQNFHIGLPLSAKEYIYQLLVQLLVNSGHIWDVVKRITIYRKSQTEPDKKHLGLTLQEVGISLLSEIEADFNSLLRACNIKLEAVAEANWTKLADADKGRYASGSYSDEEARNRRDEQR